MFKMSNRIYDILKEIAQVWLPALGALYVGLAKVWGIFPYPAEIAGTLALLDAFLGTVLHLSSKSYYNENDPPIEDGGEG